MPAHEVTRTVVVGMGGHATVCADVLESAGFTIDGFVGPTGSERDLGAPHLGTDEWFEHEVANHGAQFLVAIGDNAVRAAVQSRLEGLGGRPATVVSPSAVVSRRARVGAGSIVMPGAVINSRAVIGRGVVVNTGATIDHDCTIEDWCHVGPGCNLAGTVHLGSGAFLGVGVAVIPNVTIGAWSTVGAGAVVITDVPARSTAIGVPARVRP
jgi:sugar O-acyltransferase (sialic acid O-acetyltransferase NeuD family)